VSARDPTAGLRFVPEAPRAVFDATLDRPVLLLGWWHDAAGRRVLAEVLTVSTPRRLAEIREVLTPSSMSLAV
jgi:hypothetical protein